MKTIALAALAALAISAAPAMAEGGIRIGVLTCGIGSGVGYIITSTKEIDCVFNPSKGGRTERYSGKIRKFGLDLGVTHQSSVAWAVFAPGSVKRGSLEGYYAGVSAEVTVAVGLGANALIGGFKHSINLQPLSLEAQTGLNVTAAITGLKLDYTGR
jgi:Protein of unknown function (DUF992)